MPVRREDLYKIIDNISEKNLEKVKQILETLTKYEEQFEEVEPTNDEKRAIEEAMYGEFHSFEDVFKDDLDVYFMKRIKFPQPYSRVYSFSC